MTKYVSLETIHALYDLGVRDFGESRPQSLWTRAPLLPDDVRWHFIGRWQTNKVKRTLPLIALAHSVDSWHLAERVSQESVKLGLVTPILVEVLLSGEESKAGFDPEELATTWHKLRELPGLNPRGLMTMAAESGDPEDARPTFRQLRELRDELCQQTGVPGGLPFLSMGMSQDFEQAIEEGATHVRVGSALFEGENT